MLGLPSNIILLTFLYFIQGLPYGFQARFLPILLREQGISLTSLGLFKLLLTPWLCKALWAPLVDKYGTKRKWLLGSVLGLVVTCLLGCLVQQHQLLVLCVVLFFLNFFAATQDIAVDSLAVAILSEEELGQGNTAQVVGYKIGSTFGGGVLLWSLEWVGWTGMFLMLTALYIEAFMFVFVSPSIRHLDQRAVGLSGCELDGDSLSEGQFDDAEDEVFMDENVNSETPQSTVEADVGISSQQGTSDNSRTAVHNSHRNIDNDSVTGDGTHMQSISGWHCLKLLQSWKPMEKLSFVWAVLAVPGTRWMMLYVSIYKLGEQGAVGMLPLFLIDQHVSAHDVSFWTGLVGQGMSILGSVLGGVIITKLRLPVYLLLQQFSLLRMLPLGAYILLVSVWRWHMAPESLLFGLAVVLMNVSLLLSGLITTATFTFMMCCSRAAPPTIQATHYSILATLEVFGKLAFMTIAGWLVDMFGYPVMFVAFALLAYSVIPCLFRCPASLMPEKPSSQQDTEGVEQEDVYQQGKYKED